MIEVTKVSQTFGGVAGGAEVRALAETSITVNRGELMCLIGPSGCGKSTLLSMMGGLLMPQTGTVRIDGDIVRGPLPSKIAFVFQENSLFPWNTVRQNIEVGLLFAGASKSERADRARESLAAVGLTEFENHYPSQLSGGMRQRAALARALSLNTDIILMDEPFGALDEQTRMVLGEDLSALLSRTGKTIVFVTHSLGEAVFLADRVAVFTARPGTIKEVISVNEQHPRPPEFVMTERFGRLRNELYALLHEEIRKTMGVTGARMSAASADGARIEVTSP